MDFITLAAARNNSAGSGIDELTYKSLTTDLEIIEHSQDGRIYYYDELIEVGQLGLPNAIKCMKKIGDKVYVGGQGFMGYFDSKFKSFTPVVTQQVLQVNTVCDIEILNEGEYVLALTYCNVSIYADGIGLQQMSADSNYFVSKFFRTPDGVLHAIDTQNKKAVMYDEIMHMWLLESDFTELGVNSADMVCDFAQDSRGHAYMAVGNNLLWYETNGGLWHSWTEYTGGEFEPVLKLTCVDDYVYVLMSNGREMQCYYNDVDREWYSWETTAIGEFIANNGTVFMGANGVLVATKDAQVYSRVLDTDNSLGYEPLGMLHTSIEANESLTYSYYEDGVFYIAGRSTNHICIIKFANEDKKVSETITSLNKLVNDLQMRVEELEARI